MHNRKRVAGIIGPGCSASAHVISSLTGREPLSLLNIHIAGSLNLSNRTRYPNSFGTLDSTEVFVRASLALMKENNWTRVAAFYDESRLYYASTLFALLGEVEALNAKSNGSDSDIDVFVSAVYDNYIPFAALQQTKKRVIFLLVGPDLLGKIVCLAYHEKLVYPAYQWITVSRTLDEMAAEVNFRYAGKHYLCNGEEMYASANGSLIIHYRLNPLNENMLTDSGLTYQEFIQKYNQRVIVHNRDLGDMIAPSFWASSYFDAVWSLALALNSSQYGMGIPLSEYNYGQLTVTEVVRSKLLELDFEGVSGRIRYNHDTGYVNRIVDIFQVTNGSTLLVAYFNSNRITFNGEANFISDTFSEYEVVAFVHQELGIVLMVLVCLIFTLLAAVHMLTIIYRKHRFVKASSPKLTHFVFVGCYLLITALLLYITAQSFCVGDEVRCRLVAAVNSCSHLGYIFIFAAVFAKMWRIYRIFVHFRNPGNLLSNQILVIFISLLVAIEIPVIIAWNIADGFAPIRYEFPSDQDDSVTDILVHCTPIEGSTYHIWTTVLICYSGSVMFASFGLAILTHCYGKPQRDFRANHVIVVVYMLTLTLPLGLGLYYVIPPTANLLPRFLTLCVTLITAVSLCFAFLVFLPVCRVFHKCHSDKN